MNVALSAVLGFFLGAVPFGYLLVRAVASEDIRESGSGNIGATNVGRRLGKWAWALTLALDMAKGLVPVVVGASLAGTAGAAMAAFAAVAGHCYTPFLGGRGGKGVATMLGCVLGVDISIAAIVAVIIVVGALVSRYMSLGSIAGALSLIGMLVWRGSPSELVMSSVGIAMVVVWRHRSNLQRILRGEEARLGRSS